MQRTSLFVVIALLTAARVFANGLPGQAQTVAAPAAASLAGTWRSAEDRTRIAGQLEESIWGRNASTVRTVELTVKSSGEATLSVSRRVVNAAGRTVAGSASIEEAQIVIGAAQPAVNTRIEHDVKVVKAERRYPDDPKTRWDMTGLAVKVVTFEGGKPGTLEIRVDTPEGTGSFWETLRRAAARPAAKAGAPAPAPKPAK